MMWSINLAGFAFKRHFSDTRAKMKTWKREPDKTSGPKKCAELGFEYKKFWLLPTKIILGATKILGKEFDWLQLKFVGFKMTTQEPAEKFIML